MIIFYLLYFLISFAIGFSVIPFLIKFSEETGKFFDISKGDDLKIHKKPISLLGGLAIVLSILAGFLFVFEKGFSVRIAAISSSLVLMFFVGLWDDWKWKHISARKPFVKFFVLLFIPFFVAILLNLAGMKFNFIPFSSIPTVLSFILIFIVINSVNYQDGMDGLAGGLVFISLIGFIILGILSGNSLAIIISLSAGGAVLSFLIFNFPPAKIFMGDSGSYSFGFMLAIIAIIISRPYNLASIFGPLFIIGLPIFDGIFTNIRRLVARESIFLGDRSHFYDKLMQRGFSIKKTLVICFVLQVILVSAGILIYIVYR